MQDGEPFPKEDLPARLGPDYLARYSAEEVSLHVRLAQELTPQRPVRASVRRLPQDRLEVTFVGRDFFAELALLVGLLAAHGLEIEAGHVSTSEPPPHESRLPPRARGRGPAHPLPPRPSFRTIVDVFRVNPAAATPAAGELQQTLEAEANELFGLVARGLTDEARERLDRRLAERWSRSEPPLGALAPLEIRFENPAEARWTLMEVRGQDTPGFLYALATALALRGVYVQQVEIASIGSEACDRFLIGRRGGGRITELAELRRLRAAVALIKQFAHLLPLAPDPARALRSFGQLVDQLLDERRDPSLSPLASPAGLREMAMLLGASSFLWEDFLRLQADHLLPVLRDWRERPLRGRAELRRELTSLLSAARSDEERRSVLNAFKDQEMLLVDMRHLLDPEVGLIAFSEALSDLAEAVVEAALSVCVARTAETHGLPHDEGGRPCPVAVLGLGKFGGRELGYASDIELLIVYDGCGRTRSSGVDVGVFYEQVVRELTAMIAARQEGIFHVDLRLRPHGAKGPLASPLAAVRDYYRAGGGALPFERQALIKLRRIAGDERLASEVEDLRDGFVWSALPWDRQNALHLRDRQSRELVPTGRFNVKYSPGALVEVEYAVQYLQLEHGHERPSLRTPSTLEGLDRLAREGLVEPATKDDLRAAYVFWRALADALRMVRGNARDLLLPPPESEELRFLARRLGYEDRDWAQAARRFLADLDRHRDTVSGFFRERFRR